MKTTRPILLHVFKEKLDLSSNNGTSMRQTQTATPTIRALSEACVQAACTSNSILSKLFVEGNLATFGYFDALYLFSSTLILIMSAVLEPDASVSDAVQTAFQLLRSMAETGNLPARGYYDRLCRVRAAIEDMRLQRPAFPPQTPSIQDIGDQITAMETLATGSGNAASIRQRVAPEHWDLGFDRQNTEPLQFDVLDNPFIEQFLADRADKWAEGFALQDQMAQGLAGLSDDFWVGSV